MQLEDYTNGMSLGEMFPEGVPMITEDDQYSRTVTTRFGNKLDIKTYFKKPELFLDEIKEQANNFSRTSSMGNMVQLAHIPTAMYMNMQAQGMIDDKKYMNRFLNNSDYAAFRTNTLRV
ncbi:hypothetical protein G6M86_20980 [Agrobacterium tumefaciens]|uniref:Uncharacterized protein n=1 Tax=Agrobacterium tumefaciens TaxID=358 RepID=A0AAJ4TC68_AGRTU|nr:hypothetical protein G6M86_20980 [Agrobacterium tumefaciens]